MNRHVAVPSKSSALRGLRCEGQAWFFASESAHPPPRAADFDGTSGVKWKKASRQGGHRGIEGGGRGAGGGRAGQ